jgi:ABC-type branched-subunit amino acid transport system substrate-binding protein
MRRKVLRDLARACALLAAVAVAAVACGGDDSEPAAGEPADAAASDEPIKVGHLTYHTGPFADVGPFFDGAVEFGIEVINEDPPLGRELESAHQDLGTVGEAQAARRLIEGENVNVLLNPAHEYQSYRDFMLGYLEDNNAPLMPSVHGGAIEREIGGVSEEPLFRGSPMDSAQAVAAVLQAQEEGAETVAILATEIAGSQLQKEAAVCAAESVGLEVVTTLDVQPELASYRSEVSRIGSADPDALLMFSQAEDGGTIVKQAAEAGLSLLTIGTTEWLQNAFPETATTSALEQHEKVLIAGFTYVDGPAWEFFEPRWTESEYAEFADAQNSYAMQYYDTLVLTALAIEAAGSLDADAWTEAMRDVAMGPGEKVYTYQEGIDALRAGEDIDYSGVTGEMDYTESGVVSGSYGMFEWQSVEDLEQVDVLEAESILELDTECA